MSGLNDLIPHLDANYRPTHPGIAKSGGPKTKTKSIRAEIATLEQAVRRESPPMPDGSFALPSDGATVKRLESAKNDLRSRWVGRYLNAISSPTERAAYEAVLGVDGIKDLKGAQQRVVVQVVGALDEHLRERGMTIQDMLSSIDLEDAAGWDDRPGASRLQGPKKAAQWTTSYGEPLPFHIEARDFAHAVGEELRSELTAIRSVEGPGLGR